VLFLLIAVLFLRNQIRPIRRLAEAADNFGRGVDTLGFRPSGATEVRKAARAFIVMRERIKRQLRTRTEMLAGISHDLRTPLTRMKLELAMLPDTDAIRESVKELGDDVQQMEHMIQEYLDFARGEGREEAIRVSVRELLEDVVNDYRRLNEDVVLASGDDGMMDIRASGFRRVLHNVIDNALRYGKRCDVLLRISANYCEIIVDDEGAGIPQEKRDEVFKPFNRLDPSRNTKTGGVGLGLTIARDIVLAHGGNIALDSSPKGGLRVIIRLPS
jgi:two-component system osmolarity sensor histidine kinase EnvZ